MIIQINEQKVDFTLEDEKKAGQIYIAINKWLKNSGHLIYSFTIDGIETDPLKRESWIDKNTDSINTIDVTALTEKEYLLTGLLTVAEYISILLQAVGDNSKELIKDLINEYPSIIKNIPVLIKGKQGVLISSYMNEIFLKSGLLDNNFKNDMKDIFLSDISKISELINSAAKEIEDPLKELSSSMELLKKMTPLLNEVSILLQTGKDHDAMTLIIQFTELLQKILHIISFFDTDNLNIDGVSFETFSEGLNSVLSELVEAFNSDDSVLIGDLLEYEIAPKLNILPELVNSVKLLGE